jgi:hypothetical protein
LKALRYALTKVKKYDQGLPKRGEGAAGFLSTWRYQHKEAIKDAAGFLSTWRYQHREAIKDAFDKNPVPRLDGGPARRKLRVRNLVAVQLRGGWNLGGKTITYTSRQLACIALLCGSWPGGGVKGRARRVGDVIRAEQTSVAGAVKEDLRTYRVATT